MSTRWFSSALPRTLRAHARAASIATFAFVLTLCAVACGSDATATDSDGPWDYKIAVGEQTFWIRASVPREDSALANRWRSNTTGVVMGKVVAGANTFNAPWSWHLDPATVQVVDMAMEWCDGRPSDVEEAMRDGTWPPVSYCPWGARVVGRRAQASAGR